MKIRSLLLCIYLVLSACSSNAQHSDSAHQRLKTKNIAWFTPSGAGQINGLAVGIQAFSLGGNQLTINGVNADAGLLGLFAWAYSIKYMVSPKRKRDEFLYYEDTAETFVNGLSISMGGELGLKMNGINISGGITSASILNGISVTGFMTSCNNFRGITISGFHNRARKGVGIQIGLVNYCEKLKGLQFGLWNTSGKRGLPFFNWGI